MTHDFIHFVEGQRFIIEIEAHSNISRAIEDAGRRVIMVQVRSTLPCYGMHASIENSQIIGMKVKYIFKAIARVEVVEATLTSPH